MRLRLGDDAVGVRGGRIIEVVRKIVIGAEQEIEAPVHIEYFLM